MTAKQNRVTSGVSQLDDLLGDLFIGDNVVWYDSAGSLAAVFSMNFIRTSISEKKPLIYVSFDHPPKILLEKLGPLAKSPYLTILDCFTFGKGGGSDIFLKFYGKSKIPCRIVRVEAPREEGRVMDVLYGLHAELKGDVRFVFESLTGMSELWEGDESILKFYSRSCPRLYALNTIAYWIIEKDAHTRRLRAHINKIAQVAIDLSLSRGKTSLTILKADNRDIDNMNKPFNYWSRDLEISFDLDRRTTSRIDLGTKLKKLRTRQGLSQTELARQVGVTPSNISQVESNLIYPSLPALMRISEILSVNISLFFQDSDDQDRKVVFPSSEAVEVQLPNLPRGSVSAKIFTPASLEPRFEPYLIEVPPGKILPSHFFIQKGEEFGYVLSGRLEMKIEKTSHEAIPGDLIYLYSEMPCRWKNPGSEPARLLWIKARNY